METAKRFYGTLMGWSFRDQESLLGPYTRALRDDHPIADLVASRGSGEETTWSVFFTVNDPAITADLIRDLGGTVGVGPVDFGDGRLALTTDPSGAAFGVWETVSAPRWHRGEGLQAMPYAGLHTTDVFGSAVFYGRLFNWDPQDQGRYDLAYEHGGVVIRIDERVAVTVLGDVPRQNPAPYKGAHWRPIFPVPDADETAELASALGGTVLDGPSDGPYSRTATLRDPLGGVFTVASTLSTQASAAAS